MNALIIVLLIVAAIIVIILIRAATAPNIYSIREEVVVNRPQPEVFNFIKFAKNQQYYSKWVMLDPNSRKTYNGVDGTVGFAYTWDSDNKQVGQGEQTIIALTDQSITTRVRFIKPFEGALEATLTAQPAAAGATRVTWQIEGKRNFAMRIFHILFNLKKALAKDMAESLANLKQVLEKNSPG